VVREKVAGLNFQRITLDSMLCSERKVAGMQKGVWRKIDWLELSRFVFVGGSTCALYFLLIFLFVEILGIAAIVSSSIAYVLIVALNYLLHYTWTFKSDEQHKLAIVRYLLMCLTGFLINGFILWVGLNANESNLFPVQVVAMLGVLLWNFIASTFWVFNSRPGEKVE